MKTSATRRSIACSLALLAGISTSAYSQAPQVEWQECLGGTDLDAPVSVVRTADGGFVTAGTTVSDDVFVTGNHGNSEYWIVKQDPAGSVLWQKCLGGTGLENCYAMKQTSDGGFVLAGTTMSNDGDVSGNHGSLDAWIVKLDSAGGIEWQKAIGGTTLDIAYDIVEAGNGDLVVCGASASSNGDVQSNAGGTDFLIARLHSNGTLKWTKTFGGTDDEYAYSICQSAGGGFLIAGYTLSDDGDVSGNHGGRDMWILKLNANDNFSWQRCLGGSLDDEAYTVMQLSTGQFLAAGYSMSSDGDVGDNRGGRDYWMACFTAPGNVVWEKNYGGSANEEILVVRETADSSLVVGGYSTSNDGQVNGNHGISDVWLVKTDLDGKVKWNKCYGGTSAEYSNLPNVMDLQVCPDNSFILVSQTASNNGNVSGWIGNFDYWTAKLTISCDDRPANLAETQITGTGAKLTWEKTALAQNYHIRYRKVGAGTWINKYTSQNTGAKFLTGLDTSTTYEWKVRARCQSGPNVFSKWSKKSQFTTLAMRLASPNAALQRTVSLSVFPNPADNQVTVRLESTEGMPGSDLRLEILTLTGQSVFSGSCPADRLAEGMQVDLGGLPRGVYLVRLTGAGFEAHRRLVRN